MAILEVTNWQWNCVLLRIAKKMDDSSENISKIDSGKCITTYRYWLQKLMTKKWTDPRNA